MSRLILASAAAAALALLAAHEAHAQAAPVVRGPESVSDWYQAGDQFVRDSERIAREIEAGHGGRREQGRGGKGRAKNVVFFVGDGMGISTVTAARILEGQLKGKPGEENRLSFENYPHTAFSKTYSWDQQTSDSAPTMTAMVTGYKAREGMLSVDHTTARGECSAAAIDAKKLETILEMAARVGKSTGIVSTARITHATPAALYAHTAVRDWEADSNLPVTDANTGAPCRGAASAVKDIARQLIEVSPAVRTSLKVALGGGRTNFLPNTATDPEYPATKGRRLDGRDLAAEWVSTRGAQGPASYVWNKVQFEAFDPAHQSYLLGLFEPSHVQYEADKAKDGAGEPTLTEMTDKALRLLMKDRRGFFLHVEGGRIDHAHHAGNAKRALVETIEFSNAIRRTMEMLEAAGQLEDTLIVVSADHSHVFTIAGYPSRGNNILGLVREVPAKDGAALANSGDANGLPYTTLGYQNGPGYRGAGARPNLTSVDTADLEFLQEAAIPMGSETHAGEDVGVYARGPKAYLVRGTMEQNWIFHVMREAFGF